jgi:hypothetical protein
MKRHLGLILLVVLQGCGADTKPGSMPDMQMPQQLVIASCSDRPLDGVVDFYARQDAYVHCDHGSRCGQIGASERDACIRTAIANAAVHYAPVAAAVAAGRLTFDAASACTCLDHVLARDCANFGEDSYVAACDTMLRGAVAVGGSCDTFAQTGGPHECAGICMAGANSCTGTCQAPAAPSPCGSGAACANGQTCVNGHCSAGNAGEACAGGYHSQIICKAPMVCNSTGLSGTCGAAVASGGDCGPGPNQCQHGLYCQLPLQGAQSCVPRAAEGESCEDYQGNCQDGLYCKLANQNPPQGTCAKILDLGDPCDPNSPDGDIHGGCPADMYCPTDTMRCTSSPTYQDVGSACDSMSVCRSLSWDLVCEAASQRCMLAIAPGQPCTPPPQGGPEPCFFGRCDATTMRCVAVCM